MKLTSFFAVIKARLGGITTKDRNPKPFGEVVPKILQKKTSPKLSLETAKEVFPYVDFSEPLDEGPNSQEIKDILTEEEYKSPFYTRAANKS